MPIDVGGPSGTGQIAPVAPIEDPLKGLPDLQRIASMPLPTLPGLTGQQTLGRNADLGYGQGPSVADRQMFGDPANFSVRQPQPVPLTVPIPDVPGKIRSGAVDLNLLDLVGLPANITGQAIAQQRPLIGNVGFSGNNPIDPNRSLASIDISPLNNMPSRLLDYALAPAVVAYNSIAGRQTIAQLDGAGLVKYAFQNDPSYWPFVAQAKDQDLQQIARLTAQQYDQQGTQGALFASLMKQMQTDRDAMQGMSSGDDGIDYTAKSTLAAVVAAAKQYGVNPNDAVAQMQALSATNPIFNFNGVNMGSAALVVGPDGRLQMAQGLQQALGSIRGEVGRGAAGIPIIGNVWRGLQPMDAATEAAWRALTPESRQTLLQLAAGTNSAMTMMATVPLLSGIGQALAVAGRASEAASTGAQIGVSTRLAGMTYDAYNTGLNLMAQGLKVGLGVALANWGLEVAVPGYTDFLGKQIDMAHPVSDSQFGAFVNQVGFFVSPVDYVGPYARAGSQLFKTVMGSTVPETTLFRSIGGAEGNRTVGAAYRDAQGNPLDMAGFDTSARRLTLSEAQNYVRNSAVREATDILQSRVDPPPELAGLSQEELQVALNDRLLEMNRSSIGTAAADLIQIVNSARKPLGFWATEADRVLHDDTVNLARGFDDQLAQSFQTRYGASFWGTRLTEYSIDGFKGWLSDQADRMGWQLDMGQLENRIKGLTGHAPSKLNPAEERLPAWQSFAQKMYHFEYDMKNGLLQAVAADTEELPRLTLVRGDHLFQDMSQTLIDAFTDDDPAFAAAAETLVRSTKEGQEWWAQQVDHSAIDPVAFVKWLTETDYLLMKRRIPPSLDSPKVNEPLNAFHRQLLSEKQWQLAYKPEYRNMGGEGEAREYTADGEPQFVSVHRMSDDTFVVSPFLDYPMESADQVQNGNSSFVSNRLDGLVRGFRTWHLGEFQKAMTFRILTRYDGITAAQIDRFFSDVMAQAQKEPILFGSLKTSAQALAARQQAVKSIGNAEGSISVIAKRIFGEGTYRNLDTGELETPDYVDVVQKAFRHSQYLNLTAGVTGRLKTLPHGIGTTAALFSDFLVPLIRFTFSPIFRVSEFVESGALNGMRGLIPGFTTDPLAAPLYARTGITREAGAAAHEASADPMAGALTSNVVGTKQSPTAFLWRRRGGQPLPNEADMAHATVAERVPGIDVPQGPDAPMTEAQMRYETAKAALDQAEYLVATTARDDGGLTDIVNQPDHFGSDPYSSFSFGQPTNEAWAAYMDAQHEFLAARDALPGGEGDFLAKMEAAHVARVNLAEYNAQTERTMTWVQRDLEMRLSALDGLAKQAPTFAPFDPAAVRLYHGTPRAFVEAGTEPLSAYDIGRGMFKPPIPAHEDGYVYTPGYGSLADYRDLGLMPPYDTDPANLGRSVNRVFDGTPDVAVLRGKGDYADMLLRVDSGPRSQPSVTWERPYGTGELHTHDYIPAEYVDYYGVDGAWHPLTEASLPTPEGAEFSREANNPRSLYGPGTYLTDNIDVAKGYAGGYRAQATGSGGSTVYGVDVPLSLRRLDLEDRVPDDLQTALNARAAQEIDRFLTFVEDRRQVSINMVKGSNLAGGMSDLDKADLAKWDAETDAAEAYFKYHLPTTPRLDNAAEDALVNAAPKWARDMFEHPNQWEALASSAPLVQSAGELWTLVRDDIEEGRFGPDVSVDDLYNELNTIVERTGYDAMTHIGGKVSGGTSHNVTIVFNPKNATIVEAHLPDRIQEPTLYQRRIEEAENDLNLTRAQMGRVMERMMNPEHQQAYDEAVKAADAAGAAMADQARRAGPPPATQLDEIAGTPDRVSATIENYGKTLRGSLLDAFKKVWFPQEYKATAMRDLTIKVFGDSFPSILKAAGADKAVGILRGLGVPEREWADFLVADRTRLQDWVDTGSREAWDRTIAQADKYRGQNAASAEQLDEMYASPEWDAVSALWRANIRASQDMAFGVHFFNRYRSAFGRAINHPLMGVYPAAWALKVAGEWFRFLYDNRMFGPLRMGMAPAVAINSIMQAQNRMFAMQPDHKNLADYVGSSGPLGSSLFIFNLLLPGDWSAIPFPLSRSLRLMLRGDFNPIEHFVQNTIGDNRGGGVGLLRDMRLTSESFNEVMKAWQGQSSAKFDRISTVLGQGGLPTKASWDTISSYPSQ